MKREDLFCGYCVYTDEVNTFSSDSLLLSEFASENLPSSALDLCSGCGIVAMLLCRNGCKQVTAVEIDEGAAKLIRISAEESKANVKVINSDVKKLELKEKFPLITANPPYFKQSRSPVRRRNEIRSELLLTPDELFSSVKNFLTEDGEFCFCHKYDRLIELEKILNKNGLYIHRLKLISSSEDKEPYLFLAGCRKYKCDSVNTGEKIIM